MGFELPDLTPSHQYPEYLQNIWLCWVAGILEQNLEQSRRPHEELGTIRVAFLYPM